MTRKIIVVLWLSLITATLSAQDLSLQDFVTGRLATLAITSGPPSGQCVLLLSLTGVGPGTCYTPSLCLDILEPVAIVTTLPLDVIGEATLAAPLPASFPLVTLHFQGVCLASGAPLMFFETPARSATVAPLASLSDSFDATSLRTHWRPHNPSLMTLQHGGGELALQPTLTGSPNTWFMDGEGPAVVTTVYGDFICECHLITEDSQNPGSPPLPAYRLAGLVARDPASAPGARNSVHVALGSGPFSVPLAAEDKTTVNSVSDFLVYPIASAAGSLRIVRQGALFSLEYRLNNSGPWQVLRTHLRPDIGPAVEVGPMVYSNPFPGNIAARFLDVTFSN